MYILMYACLCVCVYVFICLLLSSCIDLANQQEPAVNLLYQNDDEDDDSGKHLVAP